MLVAAVISKCDYLITTDDRLLKHKGVILKEINEAAKAYDEDYPFRAKKQAL